MKTNLRILLVISFLSVFVSIASAAVPDAIILAFKAGNSKELGKYLNASVELAILENGDVYSKTQAELLLKDFFQKHTPTNFIILHEGGKEGSRYAIGTLSTNKGDFPRHISSEDPGWKPGNSSTPNREMTDISAELKKFISNAFLEDVGDGDHSSLCCIPSNQRGKARLLIKQEGILSGVEIAKEVFLFLDPGFKIDIFIKDGSPIKPDDIAFIVEGRELNILKAERLVLNIMQRMSGIATQTALYAAELKGLKTKVLDTRKTTPGMRFLEKIAVKHGGGENHRMGLYDMIMLKDNHIDFAGGLEKAISKAKSYLSENHKNLKIEVEARSVSDVQKILEIGGVNRIMLDNFKLEDTKKAVDIINGQTETESSGGITLKNLRQYAECGVDFISVGALTHQISSLDMSLKAMKENG